MSLLYRTIFALPRDDIVGDVRQVFVGWLQSKRIDIEVPLDGTTRVDDIEVAAAQAREGDLHALRLALHEERGGERWSTTVTAIADGTDRSVWVDLERVTEDPYGRPPTITVPRLVRELLSSGDAHAGPTPLLVEPIVVDADRVDELLAQLTDPNRVVPIVVVSKDRYATPEGAYERGTQLLRQILGLAPVYLLEGLATSALSEALGPDLHVFSGAVRTYLPNLTIPDRAPERHPYIAGRVFSSQPSAAATRIQRSLVQQAIALRPPPVYRDRVITMPGFPRYQGGTKDEELLTQLIEVEDARDELTLELTRLRDEVEFAALQLDETEADLDRAQARVRYLENRLRAIGDAAANESTPSSAIPETAGSCEEAIGLARQYLSNLEIGDTDFYAEELDTHNKSPAWGRKSWRALRALQDYAAAKGSGSFAGDFLAFCTDAPAGLVMIPASWVAMQESESTDNNPKYRGARTFPVPAEVTEDELIYMCSHIKIEPGGKPAPRLHFYDDTSGRTGLIYVGYFGEHLPNDQTN
jgi:hypothetical protein